MKIDRELKKLKIEGILLRAFREASELRIKVIEGDMGDSNYFVKKDIVIKNAVNAIMKI